MRGLPLEVAWFGIGNGVAIVVRNLVATIDPDASRLCCPITTARRCASCRKPLRYWHEQRAGPTERTHAARNRTPVPYGSLEIGSRHHLSVLAKRALGKSVIQPALPTPRDPIDPKSIIEPSLVAPHRRPTPMFAVMVPATFAAPHPLATA
jgi:hypothetical protein